MYIDVKSLSQKIRSEIKERAMRFEECYGRRPYLAVINAGSDPASQIYVNNKMKACVSNGIDAVTIHYGTDVSQDTLIDQIRSLNRDARVDAILVQLPLPSHIDETAVIAAISPEKDADGITPINMGKLVLGAPEVVPCTPRGILEILRSEVGEDLSGLTACIIGRSNIVGKPLAHLLTQHNCTVTLCHSKTLDYRSFVNKADIIVAAAGVPNLIEPLNVVTGLNKIIIDVGINRLPSGEIVGDVDPAIAGFPRIAVTPVPGGVGVMTVTMLLNNVMDLTERRMPIDI